MDELERLGLLTKAVSRESDRRLTEVLKPLGITPSQAEVLQLLALHGPMSLGELGGLVLAEGGHPSRLVDRMVTAGMVERRESAEDRRRVELTCTASGQQLARDAADAKGQFRVWLRQQLQDSDLSPAMEVLADVLRGTAIESTVAARTKRSLVNTRVSS
ncbi:MarR family winged helix-turn-helix transcriptional regulator [Curtobacterium sp. SL109]|uniref:MarR family winged helix-turn-helix transcriptional regulator n=1 Tax=Curtobacterium sp. SL109 TaxID=2994662 RepID=UPI002275B485|nr:MarR family transcriptional regulator [Curtobacterium sp. SL109]MCY1693715.1 MarR family transcriptional regulator [Curtobacterium sp. SL109]